VRGAVEEGDKWPVVEVMEGDVTEKTVSHRRGLSAVRATDAGHAKKLREEAPGGGAGTG